MIPLPEVNFIHVSDVHLGHQQFNLEERFNDFGQSFASVVNYALEHKVDFMVIGGDFFHKRAINAETLKQALALLQPLKDAHIPVLAIEGNHDKAFYQDKVSWLKLLNSMDYLKLLKPVYEQGKISLTPWDINKDGCLTELAGIRIIGLGYLGATTEQRLLEIAEQLTPSNNFTLLLLHAAVNKFLAQDLGGVKKEVLTQFHDKVDYLALGHIHARDEDGWFFNPGSLENCHIDEAKADREKGFYHVTVHGKEKTVQYIPAQPRPVKLLNIDISEALDPDTVYQKVWSAVSDLTSETIKPMVQITLQGAVDFSTLAIDTGTLAREIKEKYNCLYVEVQNNANIPIDENNGLNRGTINRADIEKQVLTQLINRRYPEYREHQNDLVNLVLTIKEAALSGEKPEEIINALTPLAKLLPENNLTLGENEIAAGEGDTNEVT